ncbi:hypothetical protein P8452_43112 [Trifolium repens]|nr:hypothetical protein P8452_43112 [Trifolium repens]
MYTPLKYQGGSDNWKESCECGAQDEGGERIVACGICEFVNAIIILLSLFLAATNATKYTECGPYLDCPPIDVLISLCCEVH